MNEGENDMVNLFDTGGVAQVRIARPTDRLDEIEAFYHRAIGLPKIVSWRDAVDGDHAGYDGLILGMPDGRYHLEFTHHRDGSPCPAPSRDNLLVFYFSQADAIARLVARVHAYDHREVEPENPWWRQDGHTFADPDGWRVVFTLGHEVEATPVAFGDN